VNRRLPTETSVDFQRTTWHYVPEDRTPAISLIDVYSFTPTPYHVIQVCGKLRPSTRLSLRGRVGLYLEKLTVVQSIKKFLAKMEPEGALSSWSYDPATGSDFRLFNAVHTFTPYFSEINLILSSRLDQGLLGFLFLSSFPIKTVATCLTPRLAHSMK
jgi:hypothetical protein